ncbi:sucrase ferredoxin [Corynebacterium diphtheriae]|nr:sucrase ferredoxin [Corynebacterium diphtheriae]
MTQLCSDVRVSPLPGTAKVGDTYILFEHHGPWSHDILDGGTFDKETSAALKAMGCGFYLIRRHGREGRIERPKKTAYLVFGSAGVAEKLMVDDVTDLLKLDVSGPGKNRQFGAEQEAQPIILVCTHAKRDACCAIKGRPMAQALTEEFPDSPVWECSHTKGHRFAPSMVLMPWGYTWGQLNKPAAFDMYRYAQRGQLFLPGNRGRGIWPMKGQIAEVAVAQQLAQEGETVTLGQLRVESIEEAQAHVVDSHTARTWTVFLREEVVAGIVDSCHKPAKTGTAWVADRVKENET